jgi:hypothetical protein
MLLGFTSTEEYINMKMIFMGLAIKGNGEE